MFGLIFASLALGDGKIIFLEVTCITNTRIHGITNTNTSILIAIESYISNMLKHSRMPIQDIPYDGNHEPSGSKNMYIAI